MKVVTTFAYLLISCQFANTFRLPFPHGTDVQSFSDKSKTTSIESTTQSTDNAGENIPNKMYRTKIFKDKGSNNFNYLTK